MAECNDVIEKIYNSTELNNKISKMRPSHLQADLKQELAVVLLMQPCDRLVGFMRESKLLSFAQRVLWIMATSNTSPFYKTYKRNDINKAIEYLSAGQGRSVSDHAIQSAQKELNRKSGSNDSSEYTEAMIFNKYIELSSCEKVAKYFGVNETYVKSTVKKVKEELKTIIKSRA